MPGSKNKSKDVSGRAKNYALSLLSYRPRSTEETRARLRKKGYPQDMVKEVVDQLKQANYLNDLEFACFWINSRLRMKPMGVSLLAHELKEKGVSREIITKAIGNIKKDYSEQGIARNLAMQRLKRYKGLDKHACKRRIYGFLMRRGFSGDLIREVLDEIYAKRDEV